MSLTRSQRENFGKFWILVFLCCCGGGPEHVIKMHSIIIFLLFLCSFAQHNIILTRCWPSSSQYMWCSQLHPQSIHLIKVYIVIAPWWCTLPSVQASLGERERASKLFWTWKKTRENETMKMLSEMIGEMSKHKRQDIFTEDKSPRATTSIARRSHKADESELIRKTMA